jgi:hypothetical protein
MPENRENKVYTTGPWGGNKCCNCCYKCDGNDPLSYNNCTGCETTLCCSCPPLCDLEVVITATCCDGMNSVEFVMEKASWPQAPWNGTDNDPLPPTPRQRIRMADHYCVVDNPTSLWQVDGLQCYEYDEGLCRDQGNLHPYEKWANITYCPEYDHFDPAKDDLYRWGEMFCPGSKPKHGSSAPWESNGEGCVCAGDCPDGVHTKDCGATKFAPNPVCAGQWMVFSLCCCDRQGSSMVVEDYDGECKTCSYQFRTEWNAGYLGPLAGATPDVCMPTRDLGVGNVCTCFDKGTTLTEEAIPPDPGDAATWVPGHSNGTVMIWEHVDGTCGFTDEAPYEYDPTKWRMEYRLGTCDDPVHWNCDCCFNTVTAAGAPGMPNVVPKRQAYFTAIITAIKPPNSTTDTCQSDGGP